MSVKVIPFNKELIEAEIPSLMKYICSAFGLEPVDFYFVLDNGQVGALVKKDFKVLFLNDKGTKIESFLFEIDDNFKLDFYATADYEVYLGDDFVIFSYPNGDEARLQMVKRREIDSEGFDGIIAYQYYRKEDDVLLEMQYQQMYRKGESERAPIYEYRTKVVDGVFITRNITKHTQSYQGLLGKDFDFYSKIEFDSGNLGHAICLAQQEGLLNTLINYEDLSSTNAKIVGYTKDIYVNKDGSYFGSWPLVKLIDGERLNEIILKNGFSLGIPDLMLDVYNDRNSTLDKVKECLNQIVEVENGDKESYKLNLKLCEDDN